MRPVPFSATSCTNPSDSPSPSALPLPVNFATAWIASIPRSLAESRDEPITATSGNVYTHAGMRS